MTAILWNCRGIGHAATIRALREINLSHRPSIIFLSETKISDSLKIQSLASSMLFDHFFFVPASGASGGLALLWKSVIDLQIVTANANAILALILNDPPSVTWLLTGVYGPPHHFQKADFWDALSLLSQSFDGHWCIAGDFNALLEQRDKFGGKPFSSGSTCKFRRFVDLAGLLDLGYVGYPFTWNNMRVGKSNIQERLDRGFCTSTWRIQFPHASIHHLPAYNSDHKPLLLHTRLPTPSRPKPFRFEEMWIRDSTVGHIISHAWTK